MIDEQPTSRHASRPAIRTTTAIWTPWNRSGSGLNAAAFALVDADKDGKVFEKEYLDVFLPLAQMEQARVLLDVTDGGRDLFRILDANSDDRLGPREFEAAVARMSRLGLRRRRQAGL